MLFTVCFTPSPSGGEEIQVQASPNASGKCVLNLVIDHIETLINEWFYGMRGIQRLVPCSACEDAGHDPHEFALLDFHENETEGAHFKCGKQNAVLSLHRIAPDLTFQDIEPHLIIPNGQLKYDKNEAHALGKGSFGTVYRGEHGDKPAAIKEFRIQSYREVRKELNVLRRVIHHPNFVRMFGVSTRPLCIVMELASKGSLEAILFGTPAVEISRYVRMRMACEVSDALSFLHHLGIVYRDLKPANVLVYSLSEADHLHVKLSDFGTATLVGPSGLSDPVSPTRICAPEMLEFASTEKYGTQVDVYSLGILFYNLITRKQAFHGLQDSPKIKKRVLNNERPPWKDHPDTTYSLASLSQLMCLCWKHVAADRPTAAQVREQLVKPVFQALMGRFALGNHQTVQCIRYFPNVRQIWIAFKSNANISVSVFLLDEKELRRPFPVSQDASSVQLKFMCPVGELAMLGFEDDNSQVLLKFCHVRKHELVGENFISLPCGSLNDVTTRASDVTAHSSDVIAQGDVIPEGNDEATAQPNDVTTRGHDVIATSEQGCFLFSSQDILQGRVETQCLSDKACSAVVVAREEVWLSVGDSISVHFPRSSQAPCCLETSTALPQNHKPDEPDPEPSVTSVSELSGKSPSTKLSLSADGRSVWSLRDNTLIKWNSETKERVLTVDCASGLQSADSETVLPKFGHVTCFAPAHDSLWQGTGSGYIVILDTLSGKVLAWFRPYKAKVKSLTFCAYAEPPRMISCGAEINREGLGTSDVICPLSVERGELILGKKRTVKERPRHQSRHRRLPCEWSEVNPKELGHVSLMWHVFPARAFHV